MRTMMKNERGIAMVAVLLVMLLMSALMVGFTTVVMSDQRFRGIDRDRTQAFYAAHSGLEKMTVDLHNLFFQSVAPTQAQLDNLMTDAPVMDGIQFVVADNSNGYTLRVPPGGQTAGQIRSGPYQGLIALKTLYNLDATARTRTGGEVHLTRKVETVAIPVFQFGMFSDVDLSFFAGPQFNFGGRVHTNGNLFLSGGSTLTLREKVTAVGEIVRQRMSNGESIDTAPAHNSNVSMARAAASFRDLLRTEGSVVDGVASAQNPAWTNISLSTYNGYIRNGRTGARPLNLPVITSGGSNPDLVRRPAINSNEDVSNPTLYAERFYSQVSLRILLSDTQNDLIQLPGVTPDPPLSLDQSWEPNSAARPAWYGPLAGDAVHPGLARSGGNLTAGPNVRNTAIVPSGINLNIPVNTVAPFTALPPVVVTPGTFVANGVQFWCRGYSTAPVQLTGCNVPVPGFAANMQITTPAALNYYLSQAGTPTIGGWIKIERQAEAGGWTDVTAEILGFGLSARSQSGACGAAADPSPNAIIRIQRVRNNAAVTAANACTGGGTTFGSDFWPLALFDAREGLTRDVAAAGLALGGVMHYVQLDVTNLSQWFQGAGVYAGLSGPGSKDDNGFSVYFSDRRNNGNAMSEETGEYGFEDVVNPATAAGAPNGILDAGEDVNANATLETYGQNPMYNGALGAPPGALAPLTAASRPWTLINAGAAALSAGQAQSNRAILFRRALKLVRGGLGNIVMPGLTIVAENPIYVQGDWNAAVGFPAGAATAIIGDTVTLLSNNWNDDNSFLNPYTPGARVRPAQSYYRFATIAGKPPSFPRPTAWGSPTDFGTDGGAHNFLHMLESGGTVNYRGSIATFFYSRQATGTYKCCATVYGAPTRNFNFDTNFLTPALLPPLTPMFRDVNTLGFSQEMRPGQ
jgi:hypothetical protein